MVILILYIFLKYPTREEAQYNTAKNLFIVENYKYGVSRQPGV